MLDAGAAIPGTPKLPDDVVPIIVKRLLAAKARRYMQNVKLLPIYEYLVFSRPMNLSQLFHPAVAKWFVGHFAQTTPAQAQAWPAIKAGHHTLIAAPTGSGKTLAAFLAAVDDLVHQGVEGRRKKGPVRGGVSRPSHRSGRAQLR